MIDYKPLLKNRNFLLLWNSQVLSQFAINLLNFVIITSLYKETGSAIAISLVWLFYAIPVMFLGPIASAGVDLFDKKKLLILTNLIQAIIILFYSFAISISVFLLYGLVFMYSVINQFYVPTELAAVPYLVKKDNLAQANGLFLLTHQIAIIFGFGFASILLKFVDFRESLYFASILLFAAFLSVLFIRDVELNNKHKNFERTISKFFKHIVDGYVYIKSDKYILAPLGLIIALQVGLAMAFTNLPILAEELLNAQVENAGILIVVPAGIGAGIGTLIVPKVLKRYRKLHVIKHSMQLVILSLFILNFASDTLPAWVGYISIILLGLAFIGVHIPSQTFLQEHTPDKLRGRVFGNLWILTTLFTVAPLVVSASVVEIFGIRLLIFLVVGWAMATYLFLHRYGEKMMYNS